MNSPDFEQRPWGRYFVLADAADCKVKRLEVDAGKRLSYQRHARRCEHWFVVDGVATVTIDGVEQRRTRGESIDVPVGAWHRLANLGERTLVVVEVQLGDYFGEDDIERQSDDFGRV